MGSDELNLYRDFDVCYSFNGHVRKVNAACSKQGILNVRKDPLKGSIDRDFLTSEVSFYVGDLKPGIPSSLVYEMTTGHLPAYHAKYKELTPTQETLLSRIIQIDGYPAPWKRSFPRLSVDYAPVGLDVPETATCRVDDEYKIFTLENFTINGILIKHHLDLGEPIVPGMDLTLNLVFKSGLILSDFKCRVVRTNIFPDPNAPDRLIQSIGLMLLKMSHKSGHIFRKCIADYCRDIKKFRTLL